MPEGNIPDISRRMWKQIFKFFLHLQRILVDSSDPWFPKYNGNCSSNIRAKRVSISLQDLYELFTSFSVEK